MSPILALAQMHPEYARDVIDVLRPGRPTRAAYVAILAEAGKAIEQEK